ncbi:MAG: hypothetical protein A3I79_01965 [Gemmatimonadetes bacterium RIFCSPLOWO2_02_FULL_71_11]|nr:MAG: hypothetical protein A3I79_01965 [Gemmatimonadetes bacterium RIFCSPLOWO2_02_FULL_71_11]
MEVVTIPFDPKYLAETLAMMRKWSPDHPELGERSLYDWQRCTRYLALAGGTVVGHIAQIEHEFRYADGRPPVKLGWGVTLVLDMSDDDTRKAAGRGLLKACEDALGLKYAAVGVVPAIEPAYRRRGHQVNRGGSNYYARLFRPGRALAYWRKPTALGPLIRLANAMLRPQTRVRFGTLEPITRFLPEWDSIWDDLMEQQYELFGTRGAEFLNYKLAQPNRKYFTYLHRDPSGAIDGYIVYRRANHLARDMDLVKICAFVGSRSAKLDMFAEAMRFAISDARGTYGIVGLSSVADAPEFRSTGMYVVRPYPVVLAAGIEGRIRVDFFDSDLDNLW